MTERLSDKIDALLLPLVRKPSQYLGGEVNQIIKSPNQVDVTVALAFPDTYAIGMSHLGFAILYDALNRLPHVAAERVYCPWIDAADIMRTEKIPLFSWESRRPLHEFDIVGITLQHELSYSNLLYLLDLAGIAFYAARRQEDEPLIIGGGPLADCCEPVADFFDLVILGDGEEALPAVIDAFRQLRKTKCTRRELLLELGQRFNFVYVPQFYHCEYNSDGTLVNCVPNETGLPTCIRRTMVDDLDSAVFPTAPIIPYTDTVHDRIAIEIMRGCPQRCAFCISGHTKGKVRCRSVENILDIAWQSYLATGHDTVSLLSLSSSDYPELSRLLQQLYQKFQDKHVGISLPSLRVDKQLHEVPAQITNVRREGLTVAVETASDRIRRAIGKHVADSDLIATMEQAYRAGWRKVKLYFMIGFPGETENDILDIVNLTQQISNLRREVAGSPAEINATVSFLVPKPHTPFAWIPQQTEDYFQNAKNLILDARRQFRGKSLKFKFHNLQRSLLEAVFSRGDRRLSCPLETAYRNGARFDSWDECFSYGLYLDAFKQHNLDPAFYSQRERPADESFPWDHLAGDNKKQLHQRLQQIIKVPGGSENK